ncbi:MAG: hypothetical protein AAGF06_00030 [Pseudomonadota bacterium]
MSRLLPRNHKKRPKKTKRNTPSKQIISSTIEHIDTLGQGVSKVNDTTTFTAKTLAGETCDVRVVKQRKGVQFAQLIQVTDASELRQESDCPHYADCSGCHYLHTSYEHELTLKQQALTHHLRGLSQHPSLKHFDAAMADLTVIASESRFGYRNRMQLHYNKQRIGLVNGLTNTLVEIPQCRLIKDELRDALHSVHQLNSFPKPPTKTDYKGKVSQTNGHCEIYLHDGEVHTNWNKAYAHGGFTQVNDDINQKLLANLRQRFTDTQPTSVLDLFSGQGNLSSPLCDMAQQTNQPIIRTMVDAYPNTHDDFHQANLYDDSALAQFTRVTTQPHYDLMIVDPPRKGFPNLNDWVCKITPNELIYISCYPISLARDLRTLTRKHIIKDIVLFDMFPGTHHFETLVHIQFK